MQVETGVLYNVAFETPLQIAGRTLESVEAVCHGHLPTYDLGNLYLFASRDPADPDSIVDLRILFLNKGELDVIDGKISVPATAHVTKDIYYPSYRRFGEDQIEAGRKRLDKILRKAEGN